MTKDSLRQTVNVVALIVTIAVNILANALPLNGLTTGEISDNFDVYFVPAGYVFSIWGLIYLALAGFVIYQALPAQRENPRLRRVGYLFALSCLANCLWIFLWHYELFVLTLVAMGSLLLLLIAIYLRLDIGRERVSRAERWLLHLPFQIYLGWITVATLANITSVLDYVQWEGGGIAPQVWAIILLAAGLVIAIAMAYTRRDFVFILVLGWAYAGIAVEQADAPLVAGAAWVATVLLVLTAGAALIGSQRRQARLAPAGG